MSLVADLRCTFPEMIWVFLCVHVFQPVGTGLDLFENRPTLSAWKDRVKKELGEALFDEAHKTIMDVASLPQTFENNGMLEFLKPKIQKMFN